MTNLGGHDVATLLEAFRAQDAAGDQPTCFIAYTVKGMGLPFAGHKDNHAGLMTKEQMQGFKAEMRIRDGHEWDRFEGLDLPEAELQAFLGSVPFATPIAPEGRRLKADPVAVPDAASRGRRWRRGGNSPPSRPSARCWRSWGAGRGRRRRSPSGSSPPARTSPSRPISAPG